MPPLRLDCLGAQGWQVEGEVVAVTVDGGGVLRGLRLHGEEVVAVGPLPCLWRAPTDNDEYGGYAETWRRAGLDSTSRVVEALRAWQPLPQLAVVQVDWSLRGGRGQSQGHASFTYAVHGDGQVEVRCSFCLEPCAEEPDGGGSGGGGGGGSGLGSGGSASGGAEAAPRRSAKLPTLPRLGVVLEVTTAYRHATWLGDGPHEHYSDRRAAATFGRWSRGVGEMHTPYIVNSGRSE